MKHKKLSTNSNCGGGSLNSSEIGSGGQLADLARKILL